MATENGETTTGNANRPVVSTVEDTTSPGLGTSSLLSTILLTDTSRIDFSVKASTLPSVDNSSSNQLTTLTSNFAPNSTLLPTTGNFTSSDNIETTASSPSTV